MDSSNKKIEIVFAADSNCPVQAVSDPGNDRCRTRGDQFGACSCQGTWPTAMPDCRLASHSRGDYMFASKRKILLKHLLARSRFPKLGTLEGVVHTHFQHCLARADNRSEEPRVRIEGVST